MTCSNTFHILFAGILIAATADARPDQTQAADSTLVEHVTRKPKRATKGLGTNFYAPSARERPFFEKLPAEERKTGGLAGNYDLARRDKKHVGWFGIVREIAEDIAAQRTRITVEHKILRRPHRCAHSSRFV